MTSFLGEGGGEWGSQEEGGVNTSGQAHPEQDMGIKVSLLRISLNPPGQRRAYQLLHSNEDRPPRGHLLDKGCGQVLMVQGEDALLAGTMGSRESL